MDLRPGQRVGAYLGETGARIEQADGKPDLVVQSLLPLRSRTAAGELAPVDLALEEDASGFAPVQPLVGLSLSKRLGDGVALGEDGIRVVPGGVSDSVAAQVGESVVWANSDTDTDTIARPQPTGVELFSQLRSAQSPEAVVFRLELPAGAALEPAATGEPGARIVRGETVLARVGGVAAVDADGTPVPATLTVDGDLLRVAVVHRGGDFAYPILVDPTLTDATLNASGSALLSGGPWDWATSNGGFVPFAGSGYLGTGLYIRDLNNPINVVGSDQGYWFYRAPGDSSIVTASFNPFKQDNPAGAGMCAYVGVLASNLNWMRSPVIDCRDQFLGDNASFTTSATETGATTNSAIYGVAPATGVTHVNYFMDALVGAAITIQDDKKPTFNVEQAPPAGWTNNDAALMRVRVSDSGLGVKHSEMRGPKGELTPAHNPACPTVACDGSDPIQATVATLDEGINTVTVTANDPIPANTSSLSPAMTVRVDRTKPVADVSGELADTRDQPRLTTDQPDLEVIADDYNDAGTASAGVKSIEILFDGVDPNRTTNYFEQTCPNGSCELDHVFHLDTTALGQGEHIVDTVLTDFAGNTNVESWGFTIDRTSPQPSCADPDADPEGCQGNPPSTTPAACWTALAQPALPGGTAGGTPDAEAVATSDTTRLEGIDVAPGLSAGIVGYAGLRTLTTSIAGATTPAYMVGSGTSGVCVTPSLAATGQQLVNGTAVQYGNTAPSLDTVLRPTPLGIQEIDEFRSSTAPEQIAYTISLTPTQRLQQLASGSVAVIDSTVPTLSSTEPVPDTGVTASTGGAPGYAPHFEEDGNGTEDPNLYDAAKLADALPDDGDVAPARTETQYESENRWLRYADQDADGQAIAIITPPWAKDASGARVPVTMAITGPAAVTMTVSHRSGAYLYPVRASRKTTSNSSSRRKHFDYGLSVQTASALSVQRSDGEGARTLRETLTMHTARLVMFYYNSCDAFIGMAANLKDLDPSTVPQAQQDAATRCRDAARWVQAAFDANLTPVIALESDIVNCDAQTPPSQCMIAAGGPNRQLARAYAKSAAKLWSAEPFKRVKYWAPLNEPDARTKPTTSRNHANQSQYAQTAAEIWRKVNAKTIEVPAGSSTRCPKCLIIAGDFANTGASRATQYVDYYMDYLAAKKARPLRFSLHAYADVRYPARQNRPQFAQTRTYVKEVQNRFGKRPRIMLTEQGVLLQLSGARLNETRTAAQQTDAAERFLRLAAQDNRVSVVAYFAIFGDAGFDSAVVTPPDPASSLDGKQFRPVYCTLTNRKNNTTLCVQNGA